MAKLVVDGRTIEVADGQNLLHALLEAGFDLPYFCWHPALGSVGACRQCAIKTYSDEDDDEGQVVMACMTAAEDGLRLSVADDEVRAFRAQVIEWLMLNHPHDCPVCDEGGECHLQDMTVMTGHAYRRSRFPKRTHRNQDLGPLVNHEMNRCIQCYRCVRFYRDHAGGRDLDVFGAHDHVYFGRQSDGTLESPFAGNLVEVCPTGVFTDKRLKEHYTRKWDLQTAPSICVHCAVGCNISPGERDGRLRRVVNRYHGSVNGYFLCDRGRYGWEFTEHERRLERPLVRRTESAVPEPTDAAEAVALAAEHLTGCDRVLGIGSPRASLEANWALRRLVGPDGFSPGICRRDKELLDTWLEVARTTPAPLASIRDLEQADAVLVLGEDLTSTAPRAALAARQAARRQPVARAAEHANVAPWHDMAIRIAVAGEKGPLYVATPAATDLDDAARRAWRAAPDAIARLGAAVAHAVDGSAPEPARLGDEGAGLAAEIAEALRDAERPVVVAGSSLGEPALMRAAANVARALARADVPARLFLTLPECNSAGAALLGGMTLQEVADALEEGPPTALVVLENDLFRRLAPPAATAMLERAAVVVALDVVATPTTERAHVTLPAASFATGSGTLVSCEGRAQRSFRVHPPATPVRDAWRWLDQLRARMEDGEERWPDLDRLLTDLAEGAPALAGVTEAAPDAGYRQSGRKVPRLPQRATGRTALHADERVHEPRPAADPDSALAHSMEGTRRHPPAALNPFFWAPGWNSPQAVKKFQDEIAGPLHNGDAGVRLLEPGADGGWLEVEPRRSVPDDGRLLLVPRHHVFGSDELSALAPGVAELAPAPAVTLSAQDAERLGAEGRNSVVLRLTGTTVELALEVDPSLPAGVATVSSGLQGMPHADLPAPGEVLAADDEDAEEGEEP